MKHEAKLREIIRSEVAGELWRVHPAPAHYELPWDPQAEKDTCARLCHERPPAWLREGHFCSSFHRCIFRASKTLEETEREPTLMNLLLAMGVEGYRVDRFAARDIEDLADRYAVTPEAELRSRLEEKARARRIIETLERMALRLRVGEADVEETITRLRRLTKETADGED